MVVQLEGVGSGWMVVRRGNRRPEIIYYGSLEELQRALLRVLAQTDEPQSVSSRAALVAPTPTPPALLPLAPEPEPPLVMDLDCRTCGACCAALNGSSTHVRLEQEDVDALPPLMRGMVQTTDEGMFLKTRATHGVSSCAAFSGRVGVSGKCGIYAKRPLACQIFQVGGRACMEARARFGL